MGIKKNLLYGLLFLVITIISGEIFARYYFGLGYPPLFVTHPTIEYLLKQNQDLYSFHNHFIVNEYGMRTIPFERQKKSDELRIMVFGDSVINGGSLTDHDDLATSLIQQKLITDGYEDTIVGNISAGSWGPGNWLAYAKEYGFFDADVIVLVLSSHDYSDSLEFKPLDKYTHPTKPPFSALYEGIDKYLPRYLPKFGTNNQKKGNDHPANESNQASAKKALQELKSFIEITKTQSETVLIFQHLDKIEIEKNQKKIGFQRIQNVCKKLNILPISLEPYFRKSLKLGNNPFQDNIHPNKSGQNLIAEAIFSQLQPTLVKSSVLPSQ